MRRHTITLKSGICRTKEFERKGLACFAVNVGTLLAVHLVVVKIEED